MARVTGGRLTWFDRQGKTPGTVGNAGFTFDTLALSTRRFPRRGGAR